MKSYTAPLGYVLVAFLTYVAITKFTSNPAVFLNLHGIGIVGGGLFVASLASFPGRILFAAFGTAMRALRSTGAVSKVTAEEIVRVATAHRRGTNVFERELEQVKSEALKDAGNLILEGFNATTVDDIFERRIEEFRAKTQLESTVCLTLSKYSPALGLAATVLGLVDILSQLQNNDIGALGSGMAVALSGTFYGIFMSNLVFAPIAELIMSYGDAEAREREMVREGILSFLQGNDPLIVGEVVNSYLNATDRIDFTKSEYVGKSESRAAA